MGIIVSHEVNVLLFSIGYGDLKNISYILNNKIMIYRKWQRLIYVSTW